MADVAAISEVPLASGLRAPRMKVLLAVVVAAALGSAGWWLTHPTALHSHGNRTTTPKRIGEAVVVGEVVGLKGDITVLGVTPRITQGVADVRVLVCEPTTSTRIGSMAAGNLESMCSGGRPAEGATLTKDGDEYLVAEITRRSRERVRIAGYDVTYRSGLQRGTQRTGMHVWVVGPPD